MVTNPRTLRALTKAGFIEWRDEIERHWTGSPIKRRWVHAGPKLANWWETFSFNRRQYRLRYVDGCFHPFVFRADERPPSFV